MANRLEYPEVVADCGEDVNLLRPSSLIEAGICANEAITALTQVPAFFLAVHR